MNVKVVNEMASLKETNHITLCVIYCKILTCSSQALRTHKFGSVFKCMSL